MAKLLTIGKTNADNSGILYVLVVRLDCGTEVYKDYIKVRLEMIGELDVSK